GQLKVIMLITLFVAVLNIAMNIALIPVWHATGSAIAFLSSTLVQTVLYWLLIDKRNFPPGLRVCIMVFVNAITAVILAKLITSHAIYAAIIAVGVNCLLALIPGQLKLAQ